MTNTVEDTIHAALLHNSINLKGYRATDEGDILYAGTSLVDSHMIGPRHTLDNAKIASARAAHLAACIRMNALPDDLSSLQFHPENVASLKDEMLDGRFGALGRLKRSNPEAFHHWLCIARLYA